MANIMLRRWAGSSMAQQWARRRLSLSAARPSQDSSVLNPDERVKFYPKLGNRDIVGFGMNGYPEYVDVREFPAPAIRFKENTPEVVALREKEKGDWKNLTIAEKKDLYRASFRQTFAEVDNNSAGEWKSILAALLFWLSISGWVAIYFQLYIYGPLPRTLTEEWKEDMVKRMVTQGQGAIEGIASKYDHEKKQWK